MHAAHADEHGRVHSRRLHEARVDELLHARDERARHDEEEGERGRVLGLGKKICDVRRERGQVVVMVVVTEMGGACERE